MSAADALRRYLESLPDDELQRVHLSRYSEAAALARAHNVSEPVVLAACEEIAREHADARRWSFLWLEGVNRAHGAGRISVKGLKIGLALFGFVNAGSRYAWPNQQLLAEHAGWSPSNRRGVYEGLRELEQELGAIRRRKFTDLPVPVLKLANGPRRKAKDPRSRAYQLQLVKDWRAADQSPTGKHSSVSHGEALNTQIQHPPAAPDSFHIHNGSSSVTVVPSGTVPLWGESNVENDSLCSSYPRAREVRHG